MKVQIVKQIHIELIATEFYSHVAVMDLLLLFLKQ